MDCEMCCVEIAAEFDVQTDFGIRSLCSDCLPIHGRHPPPRAPSNQCMCHVRQMEMAARQDGRFR